MWKEINEERIFLMHKFFNAFPITSNADKLAEAARRVAKIDALLDIGINGTSLGMKAGDELPMGLSTIERCSVIAECVVAPEMTALLKVASNQGKTIHTGIPMLEAQLDLMLSFMKVE
jgi:shikimate 5-dehydrogenase